MRTKGKITAKRTAALLLTALMLASAFQFTAFKTNALTYSGSSSYASGPYYTRLTAITLTGNQRADIVAIAKSQDGYQEGNSGQLSGTVKGSANYTEYGRWYGLQDMWCAMFVSWCANVAKVSTSIIPSHAYTPSGLSWFQGKGQAYSRATVAAGGYTPQAGDIIYFKSERNTNPTNHIGIVTSYSGGTVYTMEGNTSSATISTNGGMVAAKSYSISNTYIVYICKPAYTSGSMAYSKGVYKISTDSLNIRDGASASNTLLGAVNNGISVTVTEVSNGWGKITYDGITGWINLSFTTFVSAAPSYLCTLDGPVIKDTVTSSSITADYSVTEGDTFTVRGWTLHSNTVSKVQIKYNNGTWADTNVESRDDVKAAITGYADYSKCGYTYAVNTTGWAAGANKVYLQGVSKSNETYAIATLTVNVTAKPIVNPFELVSGSKYVANTSSKTVTGVASDSTVSTVIAQFKTTVIVLNASGTAITGSTLVGTNCKVKGNDGTQIVIIIKGDVDGDGKVTNTDHAKVKAAFKTATGKLSGSFATASDVTGDGQLTTTDLIAIKRYLNGTYKL